MKIVFFGNWNLGYITLDKLLKKQICISIIVTNYDVEDKDIYRNKVYQLAAIHKIPVYKSYKEILHMLEKDMIGFSVAYGNEIFKKDILKAIKIYNFHPSYLPYYKGPSPIQWQIKDRNDEWGMSCHEVDTNIDTGRIISRKKYKIDNKITYREALDAYNQYFSEFIFFNINEIIRKTNFNEYIEVIHNDASERNYNPRLYLSRDMFDKALYEISDYLNRKRVLFFAGNRAELGILFPIILEMGSYYYVDLIISDTYFSNGLQDLREKEEFIYKHKYNINIIQMATSGNDEVYFNSLPVIYKKVFTHLKKQRQYPYKYAIVLGDRIESLAFALTVFYGQIPLIHIGGGDVANVPFYDTNVRHCISKLSSLHFVFSDESKKTLKQIGEEESRICNIGNPSFDYMRMKLLLQKEEVEEEFHIGEGICVIFTYHSGPLKSDEENLIEYKKCLKGVLNSKCDKVIVTYPNYDVGSEKVIQYLDSMVSTNRILIVKSLGTIKLHSIMKEFKVVLVGNSSSGLLETTYYICPALNIGDRQTDRVRGGNVIDVEADEIQIADILNELIMNYSNYKEKFINCKTMFGDGKSAIKAVEFLKLFDNIPNDKIILKKFVRMSEKNDENHDYIAASR